MSVVKSGNASAKFPQSSRRPKGRQQVAAVCYRMGKRGVEFLLVQTRSGRWIFPKGGVERGLTHAQSAAMEALEEAGAHGRMETSGFARYSVGRPKPATLARIKDKRAAGGSAPAESRVIAYLCEVSRLEPPQESNRHPTWFSAEKAQQSLRKNRATEFGAELARVVDRAVSRIQRLQGNVGLTPDHPRRDGLQEVRFEAFERGRLPEDLTKAMLAGCILHRRGARSPAVIDAAVQAQLRKVARFRAHDGMRRPILRLGAGASSAAETARNVTAIDRGRRNLSKPGKLPSIKRKVAKVMDGRMEKNWME